MLPFQQFFSRNKTVKAKKLSRAMIIKKGSKRETMLATFKANLGDSTDMKLAVKLPPDQSKNEWIAMNTMELYNTMDMVYDFIHDFCTKKTCPEMTAGPMFVYYWADGVKHKKPINVPAPVYIGYLKTWISDLFDNTDIFPEEESPKFPKKFNSVVKKILKRMFRVYAHLYYSHFKKIQELGAEQHLNTCFQHFYYFVTEFDLVSEKEMLPLSRLIKKLKTVKLVPSSTT